MSTASARNAAIARAARAGELYRVIGERYGLSASRVGTIAIEAGVTARGKGNRTRGPRMDATTIGARHGRYTVVGPNSATHMRVRCDCGVVKMVWRSAWSRGVTECRQCAVATRRRELGKFVDVYGERVGVAEMAEQIGVKRHLVLKRLSYGWSPVEAFGLAAHRHGSRKRFVDDPRTVEQIARDLGLSCEGVLSDRVRSGWSEERAATTPKRGNAA